MFVIGNWNNFTDLDLTFNRNDYIIFNDVQLKNSGTIEEY